MLANGLLKYLFATSSNWFSHVRDKQQFTDRRRPHIRLYVLVIINLHTKLCQANHIHLIAIWKSVSYELISNELLCPRQNTPLAKKLTRDVVIFSCKKNENTNILRSDQSPLFPDLAIAKIDCTATPDTVRYRSGPPVFATLIATKIANTWPI